MPPQGKRIKRKRRARVPKEILIELFKRDLSLRKLAKKYGVSDFLISNILGGQTVASGRKLRKPS